MATNNHNPKTLLEAVIFFADYEHCHKFMMAARWPDGKVACPACGSDNVTWLANARVWKCYGKHDRPKFSLKVGTIFEDSPISLSKWLPTVWLLANCKNGISSYELHRALGVTQKTAWFMLHRVRKAMQDGSLVKLGGPGSEVEVDETFIGGKGRNMQASRKSRMKQGSQYGKTVVQGLLERKGQVRMKVIGRAIPERMVDTVVEHVAPRTEVYSDAATAYRHLDDHGFVHEFVDHAVKYVDRKIHTNGLENFWSLLKRGLHGTYVSVEPFHLFRYVDGQAFRYNNRKTAEGAPMNDGDRLEFVLANIVGRRLTYKELIGKAETCPA